MRVSRIAALCLLMLATTLLAACSAKPESVITAFYKATAAGDIDKAIDQISFASVSANEMVQAKGKVQMIVGEIKKQIDANDGLKTVETSLLNSDGDKARVQARLVFNNNKDNTETYDVVREEGKWKIKLF